MGNKGTSSSFGRPTAPDPVRWCWGILRSWVLCTFFYYLVCFLFPWFKSSCSVGIHFQVVTDVCLLCLETQDANQLFLAGLARNFLITSRLRKSPKLNKFHFLIISLSIHHRNLNLWWFSSVQRLTDLQVNQLYYLLLSEHQKLSDGF